MTNRTAPADLPEAPPSNLPDWNECALRVGNSEFIRKRVAEGGYGAEPDSKLASSLHAFIYEYDDADDYRSAWFRHRLEVMLADERRKALEEAAQVCVDHSERCDDNAKHSAALTCCRKIRALMDP